MSSPLQCEQTADADQAQLFQLLIRELTDFAVFLMDPNGCIVSWNPGVERILGFAEAEWLGHTAERIFTPEDWAQGKHQEEMTTAAREGRAPDVRWHVRKTGERIYVDGTLIGLRGADGKLLGFSKIMRDITERYRNEQRHIFLVRLDDALRPLTNPDDMMEVAVKFLGEQLQVDRCTYGEVEADEDTMDILSNYHRPTVQSLRGRYGLTQFGTAVAESLRAEQPCLIADIESDPSLVEVREFYRQAGVRAHMTAPLRKAGRLTAIVAVHQQTPRSWRVDELELVQFVLQRCWEARERSRVARALQESEARYRTLFTSIDEGDCIVEMLSDREGRTENYRFIELNPAFERQTGLAGATGRRMRELAPGHDQHWFDSYGRVATTGEPTRFVSEARALGRWFDV